MRSPFTVPVVTVAAIIVFLVFASRPRGTFAPAVPADLFHHPVIANAGCITCHTPGRQAPLRPTHAPATDCLNCHQKGDRP